MVASSKLRKKWGSW